MTGHGAWCTMKWLFRRKRFVVKAEATLGARPKTVWNLLMRVGWLDGEAKWAPDGSFLLWDGTRIKVKEFDPPHKLSFWWIPMVGDRTPVTVTTTLRPDGRTQLAITHTHLSTEGSLRLFNAKWKKVLEGLQSALRARDLS